MAVLHRTGAAIGNGVRVLVIAVVVCLHRHPRAMPSRGVVVRWGGLRLSSGLPGRPGQAQPPRCTASRAARRAIAVAAPPGASGRRVRPPAFMRASPVTVSAIAAAVTSNVAMP